MEPLVMSPRLHVHLVGAVVLVIAAGGVIGDVYGLCRYLNIAISRFTVVPIVIPVGILVAHFSSRLWALIRGRIPARCPKCQAATAYYAEYEDGIWYDCKHCGHDEPLAESNRSPNDD